MSTNESPSPPRIRYVPAIGPKLRKLLFVVFALFAVLAVDSAYLGIITAFEWGSGSTLQDYFYQLMFLLHLALGFLIILPVIVFGALHLRNACRGPTGARCARASRFSRRRCCFSSRASRSRAWNSSS